MQDWKAYKAKGDWELYDLSKDIEELNNIASSHPKILTQLKAYAQEAHQPMIGGEIYDQDLIEKDRRQSPSYRKRAERVKRGK